MPFKIGVDPALHSTPGILCQTSDEFFQIKEDLFDLIFIDGDHRWSTVLRDTNSALQCLAFNGTIVLHDCWPVREEHSWLYYNNGKTMVPGNGSVWKACVVLLMTRPDLEMQYINVGDGAMIIREGIEREVPDFDADVEFTWDYWIKNRETLFPVKTLAEYLYDT